MLSHGDQRGVTARLLYEPGEEGALTGIADRDGDQVIRIERIEDRISAVSDITGRRVQYFYTNGLLTQVTDLLGHDTLYEYDSQGRITKKIDPAGHETLINYDQYNNVASVKNGLGEGKEFEFDFNEARHETYLRVKTSRGMIREVWYNRDGETIRVDVNGRTEKKFTKEGRNLLIEGEYGRVASVG